MRFTVVLMLLGLAALTVVGGLAWAADPPPGAPAQAAPPATATPSGTPAVATDAAAAPPMTAEEKSEAEIGKKASEEVEKEYKVIKDAPDLPRLQAVVEAIRPFTERPKQQYTLKIVDSGAINAFSLPGGYIYFTKGLVAAVESDDELAAVAGHEMAHVCLSHSRKLMARDDRYNKILGPLVLAAILGQSSGVNAGEIAAMGSLVKTDALNHYGRAAELEADHNAVRYLHDCSKYNPVAVLTVVEGLAKIDETTPGPDAGAFLTHPLPQERIDAVTSELNELKIPIERPKVIKWVKATAATATKDGQEIGELKLGDQVVWQPAATVGGQSPAARAQQAASLLTPMLLTNLDAVDISRSAREGAVRFLARGEEIFAITPEDAAFHKSTVEQLSDQAMQAIRQAYFTVKIQRAY
jgi:beta-barrel assembly-enhancing protease